MKITKSQLKQIIKEELEKWGEIYGAPPLDPNPRSTVDPKDIEAMHAANEPEDIAADRADTVSGILDNLGIKLQTSMLRPEEVEPMLRKIQDALDNIKQFPEEYQEDIYIQLVWGKKNLVEP